MHDVLAFLMTNWLLIPMLLSLMYGLYFAFTRRDRGDFLFEKSNKLRKEDQTVYYTFHVLKYVAIACGFVHVALRFKFLVI